MAYKYQLILLGDIKNAVCDAIKVCFFEKIHDLGLKDDMFEVIYSDCFYEKYLNKQPSFVFYFGKTDHQDIDADILKILIDNGDAVFPIYFGEKFENEVPKVISIMNGKRYIVDDHEKYVNYAFESMKLLRENRKLFISYRRTDSSAVANQLFDAFVRSNYDVFLDTYSINPAKNFQEELHHRMTDCDVLIQLYTNDFKNSEWCNEEITSANQKQIGVVEVVWPDCNPDIHNLLCEPIQLSEEFFVDKKFHNKDCRLTEESIVNIIYTVESVRARNLAARQDNLVGEFVEEARKQERRLIQEYRYLVENLENGRIRLFIPAIGVPQSYDCFESLRFRELLNNEKLELFLIYDDLCIRKRWIEHLEWLNKSLEVKTIKKKDFESWLRKQLNIFLSASIPIEGRDEKYYKTADVIAIRDSVLALASVALPKYKLIWGGHPSITPLIANILQHSGFDIQSSVTLYQSMYFEKFFPLENESVAHIIKTKDLGDRTSSIEDMRKHMLGDNEFYAGIFVGGMEGVEDEYKMFTQLHPKAKVFPMASTGAAAKIIYDKYFGGQEPQLCTNLAYSSLFKDLLNL